MLNSFQPAIRGLILDMDGVLWRGIAPIGNLARLFEQIKTLNLGVVLATNNATLSIEQYLDKLASFDVHLEPAQIINSAQALVYRMSQRFPKGGPVYLVGENGIATELARHGFPLTQEDDAIAVVVGMDRQITFEKLTQATRLIRAGAHFYGTNPDKTFPVPDGLIPGAGALIAAVETATGIPPEIAGKPYPAMFQLALDRLGIQPQEALAVGDRLETDIAGAQNIGCRSALVLSGVTTPQEAQAWSPPPDVIAPDLSSILSVQNIRA